MEKKLAMLLKICNHKSAGGKDERLVIGIGHNQDFDRLLRLRSILILSCANNSTIIIAPIIINLSNYNHLK